ncbi:hypothetical protein ABK040_007929 [Willaertia magna]
MDITQLMATTTECTNFSLTDFMPLPSISDNFFNIESLINSYHPKLTILPDAKEMLKHRLLILLFEFILRSECLFKIKKGKEKLKELMIKYVLERELIQNEIIGIKRNCNEHIDLFDNIDNLNNTTDNIENKTTDNNNIVVNEMTIENNTVENNNLKKRKVNEKLFTLNNYFKSYFEKYNFDSLGKIATSYALRNITKYKLKQHNEEEEIVTFFNTEKLMNFILQIFDYNPQIFVKEEDRDPILIFIGYTSILRYFTSEIIQLAGNASKNINSSVLSVHTLSFAITLDEELNKIALNSIYFNEIDLNYFIGSDLKEIPEINLKNNLQNNLENNHLKSDNSLQSDNLFSTIPNELHTLILRYFDNLNNLLKMRLVCKNWNYFILKDKNIWKYLTFHSLIKENIFNSIDSTFTINEMENILQNSLSLPNSPLCENSIYLRILKYFVKQNDWFNIYNLLVKSNLNTKKIICDKIDNYKTAALTDDNSFRVSIFGNGNHFKSIDKDKAIGITKIGGEPDVPTVFCKLSNDYLFIGQINCKEISAFLSARLLPKTGMIYFFINQSKHTPLVLYEDFNQNYNRLKEPEFNLINSNYVTILPLVEAVLFYNELNKNKNSLNDTYNNTIVNEITVSYEKATSYCYCEAVSSSAKTASNTTIVMDSNEERVMDDNDLDVMVLLSANVRLVDNEKKRFVFKIKKNDLKRRLFNRTMLEIGEWDNTSNWF